MPAFVRSSLGEGDLRCAEIDEPPRRGRFICVCFWGKIKVSSSNGATMEKEVIIYQAKNGALEFKGDFKKETI